MKSIRNVDVLYTIHEKSRVLEECICRVESACDTGHFESVDSALRTKPELRAALGAYIRQMLALLGMLTPQAYSTASLDVRDVQDLLQALQWEPDKASAFWPDLCDASMQRRRTTRGMCPTPFLQASCSSRPSLWRRKP